jgi:mannosyltransferase PIG-V
MRILPRAVLTSRDVRTSLWLVAILRIALGLAGLLTMLLDPRPLLREIAAWATLEVLDGRPWTLLFSIWQRWDALWYQEIATNGYHAGNNTAAFFPLFPLLSRIASLPFLGNVVLGELAVTTLACVAAFMLLYRLALVEIGRRAAIVTLLLVALSPVGFFLLAPYTEALFLATTVASFWFAQKRHPWLAGIAGAAAGLTRLQGGLLLLPLGYVAWRDLRSGTLAPRNAPAWVLPAVGVFLALAYPRLVVGETGSPFDLQQVWGAHVAPPWQTIGDGLGHIAQTGDPIEVMNLVAVVGLTVLAVYGLRRLPPEYGLYALASLALLWVRDTENLSPLMNAARYSLVIFPCFMIGAQLLRRRRGLAAGLLAISFVIQIALFVYWVRWGFVG